MDTYERGFQAIKRFSAPLSCSSSNSPHKNSVRETKETQSAINEFLAHFEAADANGYPATNNRFVALYGDLAGILHV